MSAYQNGVGVRTIYPTTNVGTTNWVVLIPSLPFMSSSISAFDSSGQVMELGICAAADPANSEVRQMLIFPGGSRENIKIQAGQRLSIRAVSGAATTGENDTNVIF